MVAFLLLVAVVGLVVWLFLCTHAASQAMFDRWYWGLGRGLLSGGVALIFYVFVSAVLLVGLSEIWVEDTPVESELASLADGSSVSGSFFLGSGSVESEPVFFFYRQQGNGSFRLEHRDADKVSIVETSSDPRMVTLCVDYSHVPTWFEWPLFNSSPPTYEDCRDDDPTTFYVPEGSIKSNYILDAQ